MYVQKASVGNFTNNDYWSSTEGDDNSAWVQYFGGGEQGYNGKVIPGYVRAVRAF